MELLEFAHRLHLKHFRHQKPLATEPTAGDHFLILHNGENPSTDYYVKPLIHRLGCTYESKRLSDFPENTRANRIVIVRYLNDTWGAWICKHRHRLTGVTYFMDDELLKPEKWHHLPPEYRRKLKENLHFLRRWLPRIHPKYLCATPELAISNAEYQMSVCPPVPLCTNQNKTEDWEDWSRRRLFFYHATASHKSEIQWLLPIVQQVLELEETAQFEIIGDLETNKMYRSLPRTRILHPMSWSNYLAYTNSVKGGLAIAPLLTNEFNNSRCYVKRFDINRITKLALYTKDSAYSRGPALLPSEHVCANEPAVWVAQILKGLRHRHFFR